MYIRSCVCCVVMLSVFLLTSCAPQKSSKKATSNAAIEFCNEVDCIKAVCPNYNDASTGSVSENSPCKIIGSCEIPNMPVTYQSTIPAHGDVACGPTAMQMVLDSFITNSPGTLSGWLQTYTQIGSSSTVSGCPATDLNCKKVITIGDKLLDSSWVQDGQPVTADQEANLLTAIKTEKNPNSESYQISTYPSDIKQCDYVAGGDHAVSNTPWYNILLYLRYEPIVESTKTYENGVPMTEIKFSPVQSGHFIAMNGYNTTTNNIMYKFNDSIYGIKWYAIKKVKLNQPFCVSSVGGECSNYIKVTQLPAGFEDNNSTDSFTYLEEYPGEEVAQSYLYKVIASITGTR